MIEHNFFEKISFRTCRSLPLSNLLDIRIIGVPSEFARL